MTAGVLLKKIGGGSALTPSTFFGDDAALVDVGEHAIERDDAFVGRNRLFDLGR